MKLSKSIYLRYTSLRYLYFNCTSPSSKTICGKQKNANTFFLYFSLFKFFSFICPLIKLLVLKSTIMIKTMLIAIVLKPKMIAIFLWFGPEPVGVSVLVGQSQHKFQPKQSLSEQPSSPGVPKKALPQTQNKKCFSPRVAVWECKNLYLVKVRELRVIHLLRW